MRKFLVLLLFTMLLCTNNLYAQETDELGVDIEEEKTVETDITLDESDEVVTPNVSSVTTNTGGVSEYVAKSITPSAIENLLHPEQVFCYKVASKPKGYLGYTINGMAIVSFCGVVNDVVKKSMIEQLFMNDENISPTVENCVIKPQMMFRFVRGVDYVDVLFSSPCHSYTVFYAGVIHTFNLSPIAADVDSLIRNFSMQTTEFVSPALLGQLSPIGVIQNDEQKSIVESTKGPIRRWEQQKKQEAQKTKGWNKLRFK